MTTPTRLTRLSLGVVVGALLLAAFGTPDSGEQNPPSDPNAMHHEMQDDMHKEMQDEMHHDTGAHDHDPDGGPPPEGIQQATNPRYEVGERVILQADHMPGMDGAEATIDSSTDEVVYMVDFAMGGMDMTNHKWVVESEMQPTD